MDYSEITALVLGLAALFCLAVCTCVLRETFSKMGKYCKEEDTELASECQDAVAAENVRASRSGPVLPEQVIERIREEWGRDGDLEPMEK
jgi:hypothetical protein